MPLDVDHIPEIPAWRYRRAQRRSIDELAEYYAPLLAKRPPAYLERLQCPPATEAGTPGRGRPVEAVERPELRFDNAKLAAATLGVGRSTIAKACRVGFQVRGYHWRYADEVAA
jgi:hypothetical protein